MAGCAVQMRDACDGACKKPEKSRRLIERCVPRCGLGVITYGPGIYRIDPRDYHKSCFNSEFTG